MIIRQIVPTGRPVSNSCRDPTGRRMTRDRRRLNPIRQNGSQGDGSAAAVLFGRLARRDTMSFTATTRKTISMSGSRLSMSTPSSKPSEGINQGCGEPFARWKFRFMSIAPADPSATADHATSWTLHRYSSILRFRQLHAL